MVCSIILLLFYCICLSDVVLFNHYLGHAELSMECDRNGFKWSSLVGYLPSHEFVLVVDIISTVDTSVIVFKRDNISL